MSMFCDSFQLFCAFKSPPSNAIQDYSLFHVLLIVVFFSF